MFGFVPRKGPDVLLTDEIREIPRLIDNIVELRLNAARQITSSQQKQKQYFDKRRKKARVYKAGDLVLIRKQVESSGHSRKLAAPYSGPMVIKTVLPNDRYIVKEMEDSHRTLRPSI